MWCHTETCKEWRGTYLGTIQNHHIMNHPHTLHFTAEPQSFPCLMLSIRKATLNPYTCRRSLRDICCVSVVSPSQSYWTLLCTRSVDFPWALLYFCLVALANKALQQKYCYWGWPWHLDDLSVVDRRGLGRESHLRPQSIGSCSLAILNWTAESGGTCYIESRQDVSGNLQQSSQVTSMSV